MQRHPSSVRSGIFRPDGALNISGFECYKDSAPDGALASTICVNLVARLRAAQRADAAAGVTAWEREMDSPREIGRDSPADLRLGTFISRGKRVYRLYGLTPAEIKIVEEGSK